MQDEVVGTDEAPPRAKKPFKASGKNALIANRKGRRVLVQRSGSEEARARHAREPRLRPPPPRPPRRSHQTRALKPRHVISILPDSPSLWSALSRAPRRV